MSTDSEFLRPALAFEREFGQFRNWWARDKRVVGNAFSLLIYLLSHERSFKITQAKAQRDLGLGRDAFLVARRKLEDAGFLTVTEYRYPAGAVDHQGRPIGGHRRMVYTLQDPPPPGAGPVSETETASAENPRRQQSDPLPSNDDAVPASDDRSSTEKPAQGFPPLKEDQYQEDQKSSSAQTTVKRPPHQATPPQKEPVGVAFDTGTATLFRELHPRLDLALLLRRLELDSRIRASALDLEQAASDVIGRAARPLGDPVAYLATAIMREPGRWIRASERLVQPDRAAPTLGRPPTIAECAARGHRWIGSWNECCADCGAERTGWRDDRDAAYEADLARSVHADY